MRYALLTVALAVLLTLPALADNPNHRPQDGDRYAVDDLAGNPTGEVIQFDEIAGIMYWTVYDSAGTVIATGPVEAHEEWTYVMVLGDWSPYCRIYNDDEEPPSGAQGTLIKLKLEIRYTPQGVPYGVMVESYYRLRRLP